MIIYTVVVLYIYMWLYILFILLWCDIINILAQLLWPILSRRHIVKMRRLIAKYSQTNLRNNLLFNMPNNKFFECWVYTGTFTKCVKYISSPYISPAPLFFWRQFSSKLQNFLKSGSFDPGESCELYNRANLRHTLLLNHAEWCSCV